MSNSKLKSIVTAIMAIAVIGISGYKKLEGMGGIKEKNEPQIIQISSKSEEALAKIPFDSAQYPNNIAKVEDGKYSLTADDKNKLNSKGDDRFWVDYSSLDSLGRAGEVDALVTKESIENHSSKRMKRPDFKSTVHIAGEYEDGEFDSNRGTWVGRRSNNEITQMVGYRGYVYNKSHSLAWSLGGDMEVHNLTLGTRAQNVGKNNGEGGMSYTETIVRDSVAKNPDEKVLYKVKPIYVGNELVPRGSHVEAFSINDKGESVNEDVWVFNAQDGLTIDYATGAWTKD